MRRTMSHSSSEEINVERHRFPHSIVWTPIPFITWLFPFIGHMGIALTSGVIRDFAGSYYVSEDEMGFGWPTRFWQLDLSKCAGGSSSWDKSVLEASNEYSHRNHNLFCDNCHSHVALALNSMKYNNKTSWNMINLAFFMLIKGKCVSVSGCLKQWLPFLIFVSIICIVVFILPAVSHN